MRIFGPRTRVAVSGEAHVAFGVHLVSELPVCQPIALQYRVPFAQFDAAVGNHFNVIRPGDMVGGNEGRQQTRPAA
jgi:hypothetical protein